VIGASLAKIPLQVADVYLASPSVQSCLPLGYRRNPGVNHRSNRVGKSPQDRSAAQTIFSVFAVVAEDTHVPPAALLLMFNALAGESVAGLQLRKWMQMLINRSLVLGSWERPQLHDVSLCIPVAPTCRSVPPCLSPARLAACFPDRADN
jgi:hypothetical protein